MPTGFTSVLYDGEQSFEDFALRCARNFGMLIDMRDQSLEAPIKDAEVDPFYNKRIKELLKEISEIEQMSDAEVHQLTLKDHAKRWQAWLEAAEEARHRTARFNDMIDKVLNWTPPTPEHQRLKDFMLSQLGESIEFDGTTIFPPDPPLDPTSFKTKKLREAKDDLEYYSKKLEEEKEGTTARNQWVQDLRESLEGDK